MRKYLPFRFIHIIRPIQPHHDADQFRLPPVRCDQADFLFWILLDERQHERRADHRLRVVFIARLEAFQPQLLMPQPVRKAGRGHEFQRLRGVFRFSLLVGKLVVFSRAVRHNLRIVKQLRREVHEPRILAAVACLQHDDRELAAVLQPAHEAAADEIPLELRQRMFFLQLLPDDVRKREGRQLLGIAEEESPFRKTHAGKDFRASGHACFIKHDDVEQPFVRDARRQNRRPQNADVRSCVDFALHLFRLQDKTAEKVRVAAPALFRHIAAHGLL